MFDDIQSVFVIGSSVVLATCAILIHQKIGRLYNSIASVIARDHSPVNKSNFERTDLEYAVISYQFGSQGYPIYIPYDNSQVARMVQYQVGLKLETGMLLDITQQPGVPYLLTAKQMGGQAIIAIGEDDEELQYGPDEIPGYLE